MLPPLRMPFHEHQRGLPHVQVSPMAFGQQRADEVAVSGIGAEKLGKFRRFKGKHEAVADNDCRWWVGGCLVGFLIHDKVEPNLGVVFRFLKTHEIKGSEYPGRSPIIGEEGFAGRVASYNIFRQIISASRVSAEMLSIETVG